MPAERLPMRKVREVLRLKYACGASERVISRSVGIGRTAVGEYVRRAAVIGITWPVPEELDDTALERRLFAPAGYNPPRSKPLPDWGHVHAELRRRGVTLALLWEEYRGRACRRLRLQPVLRALRRMAQGHHGDDAPDARGRREAVRRLRRRHRAGVRRAHRGGARRQDLRRGRWGRRTTPMPRRAGQRGAARLDRRPRQRLDVPRRRAEGGGVRQSEGRRHRQPAATSRASTAPIRISPTITAPRSCRRGCASRATRPRSRWRCSSSSASCWRGCATGASSRSPS